MAAKIDAKALAEEVEAEKNMMMTVARPQISTKIGNTTIKQFYTGCLAQAAYYVENGGEVAIIDPLREVQPYMDLAAEEKTKITLVLETHFHADFVSGHVDLAKASGAEIVFGPTAVPGFDARVAADGEVLKLGGASIVVLHTPGHTMESSCFLLRDENGKDLGVFTGDTLFIGDVGRPDLAQKAANMTQEELAAHLYTSLRTKLMTLADDVVVYPGHGAGSACGKKLSTKTSSTIGEQKAANYALRADMSVEEFVEELVTGLQPPPEYFPDAVAANKSLNTQIEDIIIRARTSISLAKFMELLKAEPRPLVIDTRDEKDWTREHIPGTVFCGIDGNFGPWVGTAFPGNKQQLVFIAKSADRVDEIATRLARIGYDNSIGYLEGGFEAYKAAGHPLEAVTDVEVDDVVQLLENDAADVQIIDVRNPGEFNKLRIERAINVPLQHRNISQVDKTKRTYVYCLGGYRSVVFTSAALIHGVPAANIHNIKGGVEAIVTNDKMQKFLKTSVCPRTGK